MDLTLSELIYAICTSLMLFSLIASYLYFFTGSKARKDKLEEGGQIPLSDTPVDPRPDSIK